MDFTQQHRVILFSKLNVGYGPSIQTLWPVPLGCHFILHQLFRVLNRGFERILDKQISFCPASESNIAAFLVSHWIISKPGFSFPFLKCGGGPFFGVKLVKYSSRNRSKRNNNLNSSIHGNGNVLSECNDAERALSCT